jgi:predicted MFS family arabinose efflux permease
VSLAAFVLLELHQRLPMLELGLFRNRGFAGANSVMLLVGLAMFGVFFYISLYVQQVLGYSPTQAGASFLPWTILIILLAPRAGKLSDRIGPRPLVAGGMVGLAGSLFWFSHLGVHESFWSLLPGMLLGGVGMGVAMAPVTAAAMSSVRPDKAGVGSAVLNSMRQVGGSLGIAVMGAIVAAGVSSSVKAGDPRPVAFVHGLHHGLDVAGVIALVGAAIAAATLHHARHRPETAAANVAEVA